MAGRPRARTRSGREPDRRMESRQANRRGGCQERKQRCGRSSVSDGADDNANNASACQGQGRHWERARVESMDNTHLWCLPPLIGGPCKSGSKPRQHWTLPPMRDPHSFHPRKAPGAASTEDLPPYESVDFLRLPPFACSGAAPCASKGRRLSRSITPSAAQFRAGKQAAAVAFSAEPPAP